MSKVKDFGIKKLTVDSLAKQLKSASFNARRSGESVDILEEMIKDKGCVKFLALSGALVPGGMRGYIADMIKNKWVDIIVSTGANMTHDIARCFGEEYIHCDPEMVDDMELRKKGIDRIYDVYSPAKTMATMEKNIQKILKRIKDGEYATHELLNEIGKRLKDKNSILANAVKNKVKVIVPAFTDCILGMQVWMYSQDHGLKVNEMKDLGYLINLNFDLKEQKRNTGAFILSGGVPKNYTLQSVLIANKPHRYVVQIVTDRPEYGGLSGATLEEAKSWGKVNEKSRLCTVICDATIALPVIVCALKERV